MQSGCAMLGDLTSMTPAQHDNHMVDSKLQISGGRGSQSSHNPCNYGS